MKKYVIENVGDTQPCPLCIEGQDGRGKEKRPPVFIVACEGGYSGPVCAPHLAALIRAGSPPSTPAAAIAATPAKPAPPMAAVVGGNGPK